MYDDEHISESEIQCFQALLAKLVRVFEKSRERISSDFLKIDRLKQDLAELKKANAVLLAHATGEQYNPANLLPAEPEPIKPGDWVRCVDGFVSGPLFTGRIYRVAGLDGCELQIDGLSRLWLASRFEKCDPPHPAAEVEQPKAKDSPGDGYRYIEAGETLLNTDEARDSVDLPWRPTLCAGQVVQAQWVTQYRRRIAPGLSLESLADRVAKLERLLSQPDA